MLVLSLATISTALDLIYGFEKSYFSSLSGLIPTWFTIMSNLPASNPANIPSHLVSTNSALTPRRFATSSAISTSKPVSFPSLS